MTPFLAADSSKPLVPPGVLGSTPPIVSGSGPRPVTLEAAREVGTSKWDLDTPSLCVDLDALESNLETMQRTLRRNGIASRPHAKTHRCPAIARLQLAGGSVGICVAKVSEAEVMFEHGIDRILMTTTNVTPFKIRRAMALAKWCPEFIQATDSPSNARKLSEAALAEGVTANVVIDVDPGGHRTGISAGERALELAQLVDRLDGLSLRGMLCYDGGSQHVKGFDKRKAQTLERLAPAAETLQSLRRSGLNTESLQRRRHGHLQHRSPHGRLHRRAGGKLRLHGCPVPRDRWGKESRGVL